jgi:hypothetical protein
MPDFNTPDMNDPFAVDAVTNQQAVEPQEFYDEWESWEDGMRNYYEDASRFKKNMAPKRFNNLEEWEKPDHINKKLTKELRIRKAAKAKQRMKDKNVFIV